MNCKRAAVLVMDERHMELYDALSLICLPSMFDTRIYFLEPVVYDQVIKKRPIKTNQKTSASHHLKINDSRSGLKGRVIRRRLGK